MHFGGTSDDIAISRCACTAGNSEPRNPPPSPDINSHLNLVSLNPKPELNPPTLDNHSSQVTQDSPKRLFLGPGHRGTRKPPLPASGLLANSMEFRVLSFGFRV